MTRPLLFVLLSYLWGAVPASYFAGKLARGIDLRQHGSGNLGATNTFRVLGARVAAPVMVFDVLKGFLPVILFERIDGTPDWRWGLAYGAAAVIGHVFPVYMRFKGGKGVATSAGVFLAEAPLQLGIGVAVWLVVLRATRMVSAASVSAAIVVAALLLVIPPAHPEITILGCAICLFVVFAHRSNLKRIVNGTESRFGRSRPAGTTVESAALAADAEDDA